MSLELLRLPPRRSHGVRRAASVVIAPLVVLMGGVASASTESGTPGLTAPVYSEDFADASVLVAGGRYWVYATGANFMDLQVMSSADLRTWTSIRDPLPTLPSWASWGGTWAPAVVQVGATFVMYYTVLDTAVEKECISVATSGTPGGPFVDTSAGPLICQAGDGGSIDPDPYVDPASGNMTLLWKSDGNSIQQPARIWGQPLAAGGRSLAVGTVPSLLLTQDAGWQATNVEGPCVVRHGTTYYLFYGGNGYDTANSAIGYATSTSLLGSYTDRSMLRPWLPTTGNAEGPQGPTIFTDSSGATEMGLAAWRGVVGYEHGGSRSFWIDELRFTPDGTPYLPDAPPDRGYELVARDGGLFSFGGAHFYGSTGGVKLDQPIVGMASTSTGHGYWLVASDGGVFTFGDAPFYGSTGGARLAQPVVAMAGDPATGGYWTVAADGEVFGFGAPSYGSTGGVRLAQPIVGMAATATGHGYWLVARDGGIFAFGDARFHGSTGGVHLTQPVVGMAVDAATSGYWLVAADGGVFAFGAPFVGSTGGLRLAQPIVGMAATPTATGYWLAAKDGGIFAFGDARFHGSTGGLPLSQPVVGISAP